MFWEFSTLVSKINIFMDSISKSEEARRKLLMTADTKNAKTFFQIKKRELDQNITVTMELSFVESIFMMYKLRKKIAKAKAE